MDVIGVRRAESICDKYFRKFNEHLNWFDIPESDDPFNCSTIDKHLIDRKGRKCSVELKLRYMDINKFDTIFIEEKKYNALLEEYRNGSIPLFINFFQDDKHVWVSDLRPFFDGCKDIEKKEVTICNFLYERIERHQVRYLIPTRSGKYYVYDENKNKFEREF